MKFEILCVDDERSALINLEYDLKNIDSVESVSSFINPLCALEYAETHTFDVALLDVHMPQMSGIELAQKLRVINPEVQLVFFSGEEAYGGEIAQLDAAGYLLKPYMEHELKAALEKAGNRLNKA